MSPEMYIAGSKVNGANIGPTWGRQDPGGPHVDPIINLAIWVCYRQCSNPADVYVFSAILVFPSCITWSMSMYLSGFWCWLYHISWWICLNYLPIPVVALLVFGQSYDYHNASEITLQDMGKIHQKQLAPKQHIHIYVYTVNWRSYAKLLYIYVYIYISNGLCFSTLPQRVLNTHMRGWLLLLLKKSKLKSFVRPRFHGCNTNRQAVKNWAIYIYIYTLF